MSKFFFGIMLLLFCFNPLVTTQRTFLDNFLTINMLRGIRDLLYNSIGSTSARDGNLFRATKNLQKVQDPIPENIPFPCNITAGRSETPPTSVHKLRPGDIDVIAAMGDSLTAGFGIFASDMISILIENRGSSTLGGGQGSWRDTLTLPNILKVFNPQLFGYCREDAWIHQSKAEFNVAESAAMSRDMPFMAESLIRRMENDDRVDRQKHWKLVSIFIGGNDFCSDMCYNPSAWSTLENHREDLIKTFRTLRDNLPRTIVSVVSAPHIKPLVEQTARSRLCQLTITAECSCLWGPNRQDRREELYEIMWRFQQIDEEVAAYPEFQRSDFAVVVQPLFANYTWPTLPDGTTDYRYQSADCFHFSQRGNARFTYAVWKNLLEPAGKKSRNWSDIETLPCPSEDRPYIATLQNS